MSTPQDDLRAAMRLLEPKIAEFRDRTREAALQYPPDHPVLSSLRHHLDLLQQEWERLRDQVERLGS